VDRRHRAAPAAERKRLLTMPFTEDWVQIIRNNVPLYNRLPDSLKEQLHGLIHVFLTEKNFEGCGGLKITDEIKVTIATQACILLLNRKTSYFKKLRAILVYPQTYVARTKSSDGIITIDGHSVRLGESPGGVVQPLVSLLMFEDLMGLIVVMWYPIVKTKDRLFPDQQQ